MSAEQINNYAEVITVCVCVSLIISALAGQNQYWAGLSGMCMSESHISPVLCNVCFVVFTDRPAHSLPGR